MQIILNDEKEEDEEKEEVKEEEEEKKEVNEEEETEKEVDVQVVESKRIDDVHPNVVVLQVDEEGECETADETRQEGKTALFLAIAPEICIQAASPMLLSPDEEEMAVTNEFDNTGPTETEMEEICGKLENEGTGQRLADPAEGSCRNLEDSETVETEVPLSPTDYSLVEEFDFGKKFDSGFESSIIDSEIMRQSRTEERLPSPTDYTLISESMEGSEMMGMRQPEQTIPEDVFAIPDPTTPSSRDLELYLETNFQASGQPVCDAFHEDLNHTCPQLTAGIK